jgi:parallel beta-helix repeat protein
VSDVHNAYGYLAGIFVSDAFDNLCLLGNEISNNDTAIHLRSDMPHVKATGNTLDGGQLRMGAKVYVDQSGNTSGCFAASPLLD